MSRLFQTSSKLINIIPFRSFTRSTIQFEKEPINAAKIKLAEQTQPANEVTPPPEVTKKAEEEEIKPPDSKLLSRRTHRVNNLEKRFLVWSGKYKSVHDIPVYETPEAVERARSRARIRVANFMILATGLACIGVIFSSKRAVARGENLQQQNIDWHKRLQEEHAKEVLRVAAEEAAEEAAKAPEE